MNFENLEIPSFIIGVCMFAFGITSLILREKKSHLFRKLEAMKRVYGKRAGYIVHVLTYSIFPICAGFYILQRAYYGISLF